MTTSAACQAIWLKNLLTKVTGKQFGPVLLYMDNKAAKPSIPWAQQAHKHPLSLYPRVC